VAASLLALGDRLLPTDGALPAQPHELIQEAMRILEHIAPTARITYVRHGSPLEGLQVNGAGESDLGLSDAFARLVPPESRAVAYVPVLARVPDIAATVGADTRSLLFASVGIDAPPHAPHGYLVVTSPTLHPLDDAALHAIALIAHRLSESLRRADQLEQLVFHDALTGLYNRNFFNRQIEREIARAKRAGQSFALAIADIDDFKAVNTEYGYYGGNDLLEQVSSVLKASIRPFDIAARWGGEEFAYILTPPIEADAAITVCDRIRAAIAAHAYTVSGLDLERHRLDLSVSIGLAMYPSDATTSRELWTVANEAIKQAKSAGKNRVVHAG
jgi:diguanylate cyclase (GGDEF)-like protein